MRVRFRSRNCPDLLRTGAEIAQQVQNEFGNVTGLRALAQQQLDPRKVLLDVYMEGTGKLKKYAMEHDQHDFARPQRVVESMNFEPEEPK